MVLSWNEKAGEREYKEVTELFLHEVELLYEVRIQRPLDGSPLSLVDETILETTWNHPFWVVDKKAWVEVKDLNVGDRVLLSNGKEVAISGIRSYNIEATKVYNFEVAENHTYFVGEDGVLVHNYQGIPADIGSGISFDAIGDGVRSGLGYAANALNMPADLLIAGSEWLSNQGALGAIASTALNIPTGLLKLGSEALTSPLTLLSNNRDFSEFSHGWDTLQSGVMGGIDGIQNGIGFVERTLNDLTGESFTGAGDAIRSIEWLPPVLSNLIASPIDIVTGGIKMGIETVTTPMQLAAYAGEFYRGERELRMGDGISTLLSGVMYPAGQMLNYGRSLAGETIASALGVAKSAIEIPIKTAWALGHTGYEALTATGAWGWNQTFGDGTKSWGDLYDDKSVASSWGSVGESFENLGGFLAHPFMVAGNPIFGGNAVDEEILNKKEASLFAELGYRGIPGMSDKEVALLSEEKRIELKNEVLKANEISGEILTPKQIQDILGLEGLKLTDAGNTDLDSILIKKTVDGKDIYILSLGGTAPSELGDLIADGKQAIGLSDKQYKLALKNAEAIQGAIQANHPNGDVMFMVTGHSLGGGLASNISKELEGVQGITFNPAGVNPMTTVGNRLDGFFSNPIQSLANVWNGIGHTSYNKIDSYMTSTDVLTLAQSPVFPLIGTDGRPNVEHIPTFNSNSILPAHSLGNFINHYFGDNFKTYKDTQ